MAEMNSEKKKQNLSRKKIINSAIMLFASKGFESTTTREICKHAGVNLSLIPYYFGNKEGLYANIVESIIDFGLSYLQEEIEAAKQLSSMNLNEKLGLYRKTLEKYLDFIYSENVPKSFVILILKEQTVPHSKFSEIYSQKINLLYLALRKTLASILNKSENDKAIILEISSVIGQILSFKLMDRATLTAFNQDLYTNEDNKKIKNIALSYIESSIQKIYLQKQALV